MTGISIGGLTKSYGDVQAVKGVDLEVKDGEFVTLLGPSGCGKTTTLRCVAGLEVPSSGTIQLGSEIVFDKRVTVPVHRRSIGMVFQSYAIWPHMTVRQNVRFPLKMRKMSSSEGVKRVDEALTAVGLGSYGDRYPSELSGGQQQRVALARALVAKPDVLLYDEPLSNLDATLREQMRYELKRIHLDSGTTSLYVTHDQDEALVLSDRMCLMKDGVIVQEGHPRDVYERPLSRFAVEFLGAANIITLAEARASSNTVIMEGGGTLVVADVTRHDSESEEHGARVAAIRPHLVEILGSGAGIVQHDRVNVFSALLESATYLGDRMRYEARLQNGQRVAAETRSGDEVWSVGDDVHVHLPPRYCMVV